MTTDKHTNKQTNLLCVGEILCVGRNGETKMTTRTTESLLQGALDTIGKVIDQIDLKINGNSVYDNERVEETGQQRKTFRQLKGDCKDAIDTLKLEWDHIHENLDKIKDDEGSINHIDPDDIDDLPEEDLIDLYYRCDNCRDTWSDSWTSEVDGECPSCGEEGWQPFTTKLDRREYIIQCDRYSEGKTDKIVDPREESPDERIKYTIAVQSNNTEYWDICANSEQEALDGYLEGKLVNTKFHGDDSMVVAVAPVNSPRPTLNPVEYEHTEGRLLTHISKYYKSWRHDQDIDNGDEYWDSLDGYDINIYNSREYDDHKEYKYSVVCYGLVEDSNGSYSINTGKVIAKYYIHDQNGSLQLIKKEVE